MSFDDVLQEVGEWGMYQKRLVVLICLTGGCVVLQNISPVFTMVIPRHRCQIPGLLNDTFEIQNDEHAWLINLTIPRTTEGDYSPCTLYDVTDPDVISSNDKGNRSERACERWVYDRSVFTETLTSQLNLVCDQKMYRSHTSMMIFAGKFLGAFLTSVFGDIFGRRRVYTVMLLAMLASAVGLIFVTSLPALMALRFLAGGTTTGSYLCTYVIGVELMGKSQRRYISIAYSLSSISLSFLAVLSAFLLRHWAHFQASLAAPCVFIAAGYFFIPESPRWLLSKGRTKEVQAITTQIARVNGKLLPDLNNMQIAMEDKQDKNGGKPQPISSFSSSDVENDHTTSTTAATAASAATPLNLFRHPRLFVRYTVLFVCWILIIMNIYGLMLNVSTMSGNIFVNFAIFYSMDLLSILVFALLIERVGRRPLLAGVTALGGLACLATILPTVLGGNHWILRGLSMVGRLGTSCALTTIYVMSPELFPTVLRSFGLGTCSMVARLGGLASPYVADLNSLVGGVWGPALPQVVFGVAGMVTSSTVLLVLPETKGQRLPETVEDAALFGRRDEDSYGTETIATADSENEPPTELCTNS